MRFLLLLILSAGYYFVGGQAIPFGTQAKIYLVRHGEKEAGEDPLLTEGGNKRAGDLLRVLKHKKIAHIYVTEYQRTQHTADSLRIQSGIDTVHYLSDTARFSELFAKIRANHDNNRSILIIGHSNTIPLIIRKLGLIDYPKENIPDNEFDNLFLITYKKGKASLKKMKYGRRSGAF